MDRLKITCIFLNTIITNAERSCTVMSGLGQDLSSCRNLMQSLRNEGGEQDKDEVNEQSDLEEEKELRIPARSRSKSMSEGDEEEGPHYHGNIDLSLPGVDQSKHWTAR